MYPQNQDISQFISTKQAARIMGVTPQTILKYIHAKKIRVQDYPGSHRGRSGYRCLRADVVKEPIYHGALSHETTAMAALFMSTIEI